MLVGFSEKRNTLESAPISAESLDESSFLHLATFKQEKEAAFIVANNKQQTANNKQGQERES